MLWERDLMSWERDKYFFHMSPQCCRSFDSDNLLRFTKMVKCLPEFEYFYCVLEK